MNRITFLEEQMDRDDLTDAEFDLYNNELNEIYTVIEKRRQNKVRETEQVRLEQAKVDQYNLDISITDEEVDEMYKGFQLNNAGQRDTNGRTFEEWFEQSLALYSIEVNGSSIVLSSKAKGDVENTWVDFVSVPHARTKLLELIKIKFRDHHNRVDREGCNFRHIPGQWDL